MKDSSKVTPARRAWKIAHADELRRKRHERYEATKHLRRKPDMVEQRKRQERWKLANPEKAKALWDRANDKRLFKNMGLSIGEYKQMEEAQGGVCMICGRPPCGGQRRLSVDHEHATGRIRDLLCKFCNLMIGNAMEDTRILEKAILYLRKWDASPLALETRYRTKPVGRKPMQPTRITAIQGGFKDRPIQLRLCES